MNEAERLAQSLFDMPTKEIDFTVLDGAAAELRRLAAINAELVSALNECVEDSEDAVTNYVIQFGEIHRPQRLAEMRETVKKARDALEKAKQ